jgi:Protein of unknown function (DUF3551)
LTQYHRNAGSFTMRILLFLLAIFVVTDGIDTPAEAQNYPWCAVLNVGDAAYNCGFDTREECMAALSGIGGFCELNNQYKPPVVVPPVAVPVAPPVAQPLSPHPHP